MSLQLYSDILSTVSVGQRRAFPAVTHVLCLLMAFESGMIFPSLVNKTKIKLFLPHFLGSCIRR